MWKVIAINEIVKNFLLMYRERILLVGHHHGTTFRGQNRAVYPDYCFILDEIGWKMI